MNRITKHQVLPKSVVHERIKQRLFRFMYEHSDRDFLDIVTLLLEFITESRNQDAVHTGGLDEVVDTFLNSLKETDINQNKLL